MAKRTPIRYRADPDVSATAALIGDPARAAILLALLDGSELPASELAARGGSSPQAASAHLGKLAAGGLITVRAAGRQRLYRLAGADVAHAIEALAAIAKPARIVALSQNVALERLRHARSCYDHLAGRLGVAVTRSLVARNALRPSGETYALTAHSGPFFAALGVDLARASAQRRAFARACTDSTERTPHLAGSLGASVRERFLTAGWIERNDADRSLRVTAAGRLELDRRFGIRLER